jgi:hypothetical protein
MPLDRETFMRAVVANERIAVEAATLRAAVLALNEYRSDLARAHQERVTRIAYLRAYPRGSRAVHLQTEADIAAVEAEARELVARIEIVDELRAAEEAKLSRALQRREAAAGRLDQARTELQTAATTAFQVELAAIGSKEKAA